MSVRNKSLFIDSFIECMPWAKTCARHWGLSSTQDTKSLCPHRAFITIPDILSLSVPSKVFLQSPSVNMALSSYFKNNLLLNQNSHTLQMGMQNGVATLKTVWKFLIKLNIHLPYCPEIPFLDIYPREMKTCPHKDLCMNVHGRVIHNSPN